MTTMTSPNLVNGGHISPTGVPASYVVVWEWENRPTWWRPYSPEVTQLLERAHNKKLNRIYLKDADPLLQEYYINMTSFEQVFEPTGATYTVRREFYPHNCPAGKGSKWEWCVGDINKPSDPNNAANWHMYDMEVQAVIEESYMKGEQTIDIGKHFPGCPYIINFCNLTQVRSKTGQVRRVRRLPQPSYPMVRLTQAEIAAMMHRKEERIRERSEELERIKKEHAQRNGSAKKKGKKKAVKHLMSQIFHMPHHSQNSQNHLSAKDDKTKTSPTAHNPLLSNNTSPNDSQNHRKILSASAHNVRSTIANLTDSNRSRQFINNTSPPRRLIGHPSSMSEYGFPTIIGRRGQINRGPASVIGGYRNGNASYRYHQSQSDTTNMRGQGNPHNTGYRRFQDYSSFSSFSDTSSIVRRPSMDTISTYLSNQEQYQNGYGNYGGSSRSFYGGSFSCSQEMLDVYGNHEGDSDSVFTDEDVSLNLSNATTNCNSLNSSAVRRLTYHHTDNISNGHKRYGSIGGSIAEIDSNQINHYGGARPKVREVQNNPLRLNQINVSNNSMYPATLNSRNRVFSDPEISNLGHYRFPPRPNTLQSRELEEDDNLYVNQCQLESDLNSEDNRYEDPEDNIYCNLNPSTPPFGKSPARAQTHKRQNSSISNHTLTKENNSLALSQHSLNGIGKSEIVHHYKHGFSSVQSSPLRGATIRDYPLGYNTNDSLSSSTKSLSKKKPVPTPRTILNVTTSMEQINAENEENQNQENRLFLNEKMENIKNIKTCTSNDKMSELDKIILRYSQIVIDPNQPDDYCPVCVRHLNESSPPSNDEMSNYIKEKDISSVICLTKCQHKVHVACLKRATLNNQNNGLHKVGYICCPTCKSVCGHMEGDMPSKGATMTYRIIAKGLPGYEDYHTIQVTYNFPDNCAVQGSEHPNPGKPLLFVGFPKTAFLPDTEKGRRVLRMLEVAFHSRLTFTVEPSGEVVWNEVELPHKTEFGPPKQKVFGCESTSPTSYPDVEYLDNIIQKLGRLGISDEAAV